MPIFNPFNRKSKSKDFLVLEVGLERVVCALFKREDSGLKLSGIGRKKFSSRDEIFNSTLESLDALSAIVPDLPTRGILGISGGFLETATTIAHYSRPNQESKIDQKETEAVLKQVVEGLERGEKKIFFSTIAQAKIDGVKITNPLGLKGKEVDFSCFVAFSETSELELFNRIVSEIEMKVEKIVPTSFSIAKKLEHKNLDNALIVRFGENKSELTLLQAGQIAEIFPVDLGAAEIDLLPYAISAILKEVDSTKKPGLVYLFADNDEVDLEKVKESLGSFNWVENLGFETAPKVEVAAGEDNFSASDLGLHALSQESFI